MTGREREVGTVENGADAVKKGTPWRSALFIRCHLPDRCAQLGTEGSSTPAIFWIMRTTWQL